ncbi:hypothetical protein AKG95_27760 [Janthinobacterium lividum]|uniref:Uncharacterized protein n=1 Tax=Janthinobacterium lividum TaxID=29581 RepID=A0A1S1U1L8_9BURK|nr:hypothetical protein AKG95_27760 [Janthinobacterium lividum]
MMSILGPKIYWRGEPTKKMSAINAQYPSRQSHESYEMYQDCKRNGISSDMKKRGLMLARPGYL